MIAGSECWWRRVMTARGGRCCNDSSGAVDLAYRLGARCCPDAVRAADEVVPSSGGVSVVAT
jgi:hypothetical protein